LNQGAQPQEGGGRRARGGTPLPLANLECNCKIRLVQEARQPEHRVSGNDRARRRKDDHLYSTLHVVRSPLFLSVIALDNYPHKSMQGKTRYPAFAYTSTLTSS